MRACTAGTPFNERCVCSPAQAAPTPFCWWRALMSKLAPLALVPLILQICTYSAAGGADSILLVAGTDATDEFNAIHSAKAKKMLADYYIGGLLE